MKIVEEKTVPIAEEAETAVMSIIINNPEVFSDASKYITPDVLYNTQNKILWQKIQEMIDLGKHIDLVTVIEELTQRDEINGVTPHYIVGLTGLEYHAERLHEYAKKVYEKFLLRLIITKTNNIQALAYNNDEEAYNTLMLTHSLIGELLQVKPSDEFDISSLMDETIDSIHNGSANLIKTGFDNIDRLSGGMTRGEVTVIGGRPGHGKTTLILNILRNLIHSGNRVVLFNREMTNVEMLKKLLTLESQQLSYTLVRKGVYDQESLKEIMETQKKIQDIYSKDKFLMFDNVHDFNSAQTEVRRFKPDVIIDDYIQLITPDNITDQRRLQIERIVHSYKWLAKQTNAVVMLVSQLNRAVETRQASRPILSDLAESGAIEQVAENVWFVYYDYKVKYSKSKLGANVIELVGAKVRYGNSGVAQLGYAGNKVKIYNSIDEYRKTIMD
jgi:replicative DNA helicase